MNSDNKKNNIKAVISSILSAIGIQVIVILLICFVVIMLIIGDQKQEIKSLDNGPNSWTIGNLKGHNQVEVLESATCDHCIAFNKNILPKLDFSDAALTIHSLPVDQNSLLVSLFMSCIHEQKDVYWQKIMKDQSWNTDESNELIVAHLINITGIKSDIKSCVFSPESLSSVSNERIFLINKYQPMGTPLFMKVPHKYIGFRNFLIPRK